MNAFKATQIIEAKSKKIILPLIDEASDGHYVLHEKGRLAKELQKKYGDLFFNGKNSGRLYSVEIKAEQKQSPNFFLEMFSNGSRYTPGWMWHLDADLLFYHFLESDELYIVPFKKLQRLFFFGDGGKPLYQQYPQKVQKLYRQINDTWGICVPILVIDKAMNGIKKANPMGLFGMDRSA